jgi:sirohydrochlorin ferrochelatase
MSARLVVAAHGSRDPRFAGVVEQVVTHVRARRSDVDVAVGYLEHGPPDLRDVASAGDVVVPLLLSAGYHVRSDIPEQVNGAVVTDGVGPDRRLAPVLAARLDAAGYRAGPVVLAAAGSADERSLDDVRAMAGLLAARLSVDVIAAFVSAGMPRLDDVLRAKPDAAVATYLLAPGVFHDVLRDSGAAVVAEPIGADPVLAEIVLDRFDAV